jgi:hypothetical protein
MKTQKHPWFFPIPVKKSRFISFHEKHQKFNIETNLQGIGTFSNDTQPKDSRSLMFSDLQINPDACITNSMGSGRSGFYHQKYLKGVGRTTLVPTWNVPRKLSHNSGILLTSSASREYLISTYLQSKDKTHLSVKCDGILLRTLTSKFKNHSFNNFGLYGNKQNLDIPFPKCDDLFHAITLKEGNFCRYSNMVWWLSGIPEIFDFFKTFYLGLKNFDSVEKNVNPSPEDIAKRFSATLLKTFDNLLESWTLGICWGTIHNNYTMDGRHLDLETAVVTPSPVIGIYTYHSRYSNKDSLKFDNFTKLMGLEIIDFVQQTLMFLSFLRTRLKWLCENNLYSNVEKRFIRDFLISLQRELKPPHPLSSRHYMTHKILSHVTRALDLSTNERQMAHFLILQASRLLPFSKDLTRIPRTKIISFHQYPFSQLARFEPNLHVSIFVPPFHIGSFQE